MRETAAFLITYRGWYLWLRRLVNWFVTRPEFRNHSGAVKH
jgi:hypothetical protein